jgi:hypothetical protein
MFSSIAKAIIFASLLKSEVDACIATKENKVVDVFRIVEATKKIHRELS